MKTEKLTLPDYLKYPNAMVECKLQVFDKDTKGVVEYENKTAIVQSVVFAHKRLVVYAESVTYVQNVTVPISDCKLILRSIDELTEEEKKELKDLCEENWKMLVTSPYKPVYLNFGHLKCFDYLRSKNIFLNDLPEGTYIIEGKAVKE